MSTKSLSIAIIGVGGIGSTFAYWLAKAGHRVTVVARPNSLRLQQLQRDGGIILAGGARVETSVSAALDEQADYDLVLVTVLAHQVEAILPALQRCKAAQVHFMFNNYHPERLQRSLGELKSSFGMPFVMSRLDGDGRLNATISPSRKTLHDNTHLVDIFNDAGIISALEPNMLLWLRCHAPLCVAMESISVMAQRRRGGASWAQSLIVARGLGGAFSIARSGGRQLYPAGKAALNCLPTILLAAMLWGISRVDSFRELLATGLHECRALSDEIIADASSAKPDLTHAAALVRAMKPEL